jgi:DNA polymerase III epsilon subunit-like protein
MNKNECYIIVDIEASGPNPGKYVLLSIGACTLNEPRSTFYIELQPDSEAFMPQAMEVNQLSMAKLSVEGIPPKLAMQKFSDWIHDSIPKNSQPLFTAFNAPFDWMFVNEYFHRYLGSNPFGHSALDIKAFYMGSHAVTWQETSLKEICKKYCEEHELTHHALSDAIHGADLFQVLLNEANKKLQKENE